MQKYRLTKKGKIVIVTFCTIIVLFIFLGTFINNDNLPKSYDYGTPEKEVPQQAAIPDPPPVEAAEAELPKDVRVTVYFEANMANIDSQYQKDLDMFSSIALQHDEVKVQVEGNCATLFPANEKQKQINYNLSLLRAQAIADYLKSKGIDAVRINIVGNGSDKPLKDNNSPEGRKFNRRVEIYFLD